MLEFCIYLIAFKLHQILWYIFTSTAAMVKPGEECRIIISTHKIVRLWAENQSFGLLLIVFRLLTSRYLFLNRIAFGVTCIANTKFAQDPIMQCKTWYYNSSFIFSYEDENVCTKWVLSTRNGHTSMSSSDATYPIASSRDICKKSAACYFSCKSIEHRCNSWIELGNFLNFNCNF